MRIAIGSDHAGFVLKSALKEWLEAQGYDVNDCGAYSDERVDYPVFGAKVGEVARASAWPPTRLLASARASFAMTGMPR
jgi:ribose 5-phosphate isomerase B